MRKPAISYIGDEYDEDKVYCLWCEKVGVKSKLKELEFDDYKQTPPDVDMFLYCPNCKRTIPIYAVKQEVEYGPIIDLVESPFDSGSEFKSVEHRSKKRRANKIHQIDDPDIVKEKGEVRIIQDSGSY